MFLSLLALGFVIAKMGAKLKPAKHIIGGYDTIRDLILGMSEKMNNK